MKEVVILDQDEWRRINRVLIKANEIRLDADKGDYQENLSALVFAVGSLCRATKQWVEGKNDELEAGPRDD